MRKLVRWLAAPVLAASAVGLVGCDSLGSGTAETEVTDLPDAEAAATEEPTEEFTLPPLKMRYRNPVPEIPDYAREHTREGASAFAIYFWEAYAYSLAARDKTLFETSCSDTSEFCQEAIRFIDSLIETDSYVTGIGVDRMWVQETLYPDGSTPAEWVFQIDGCIPRYTVWYDKKAGSRPVDEMCFVSYVYLFWDDGWKVDELMYTTKSDFYG